MAVEPRCKYFGVCGGCCTQHLEYDLQLSNKRKLFARAIKVSEDFVEVFSDEEYGYRNRMDFVFHRNGLGLREKGKWWKVVNIDNCAIANNKLNFLLKEIKDFFVDCDFFDLKEKVGTFRYAVIRTPQDDSSISFVLNEDSKKLTEAIDKIKEFAKISSAKNIVVTYVPSKTDHSTSSEFFVVKGSDMLEESYLGKTFHYSVQGFFQNNHEMAEKMVSETKKTLENYHTSDSGLVDLYGGVGGFGITNSDKFKELIIVENDKNCIDAAKKNIERNNLTHARAYAMDAMRLLKVDLPEKLFIVTDPPRSGMHPKAIKAVNELDPEVIVYISCNVLQLGKELGRFKNYKLKSAKLFDLFPQTNHCEGFVELVRKEE